MNKVILMGRLRIEFVSKYKECAVKKQILVAQERGYNNGIK